MSSGFISGGSLETPVERDDEWKQAQKELDAERARKAKIEADRGGKSLFEVLQANKAAKEEQVQQALKLSNQFLSLDEDDIDFLDSVLETERAKENEVKKQTAEQLEIFKKQQEEEEQQAKLQDNTSISKDENPDWSVANKKRKKQEKEGFRGIKLRKTSSSGTKDVDLSVPNAVGSIETTAKANVITTKVAESTGDDARSKLSEAPPKAGGLGLVAYSDSESE